MEKFLEIAEATQRIHSFSDLIAWFEWLPFAYKIIVGLAAFGALVVFYIFTIAIFIDKEK